MSKPKIDVGEGYRMLGKIEAITEGDEYFNKGKWHRSKYHGIRVWQMAPLTYRRRLPDPILEVVGRLRKHLSESQGRTVMLVDSFRFDSDLAAACKWIEEKAK